MSNTKKKPFSVLRFMIVIFNISSEPLELIPRKFNQLAFKNDTKV